MKKAIVFLAMLGGMFLSPPLFAAHVCYNPSVAGSFAEDTDSGGNFRIWGVPGVTVSNGLWISRSTPVGRAFATFAQLRLWRAQDKSLSVHIRYSDADGNIWTVSDPMTQAMCLQQTP
ncbi:MAG: hypothetical protein WBC29_01405 [Candidatus Moraniibacteriota bacterium]